MCQDCRFAVPASVSKLRRKCSISCCTTVSSCERCRSQRCPSSCSRTSPVAAHLQSFFCQRGSLTFALRRVPAQKAISWGDHRRKLKRSCLSATDIWRRPKLVQSLLRLRTWRLLGLPLWQSRVPLPGRHSGRRRCLPTAVGKPTQHDCKKHLERIHLQGPHASQPERLRVSTSAGPAYPALPASAPPAPVLTRNASTSSW